MGLLAKLVSRQPAPVTDTLSPGVAARLAEVTAQARAKAGGQVVWRFRPAGMDTTIGLRAHPGAAEVDVRSRLRVFVGHAADAAQVIGFELAAEQSEVSHG
jgi:hypothetical protein